jgi:hypothetical protein
MELIAKVEEVERANLTEGQDALIRLDALPGKLIHGKIKRLGSTASINVFRGEATKKFDCVLSIDMEELLSHVGATPEQIQRILATAEQNRRQGFGGTAAGRPAGMGGARGPRGAAAGGGERPTPSPEVRQRFQAMLGGRQPSELSAEERQQLRQRMQEQMGGAEERRPAAEGFTVQQRQNAQLPKAPEEGSDIDILLRPGLLADAEVIVERLTDVVYIPYQAVFDSPQGSIVYVWNGNFLEPRPVRLGKRSESQVVILEGLEEGDQIGLSPPGEDPGPQAAAAAIAIGRAS